MDAIEWNAFGRHVIPIGRGHKQKQHRAHVTIALLKTTFDERVISRNGPVNWPPRSFDLTPLDYFLWGYVKSLVYANKPTTLQELRANIEREIAAIPVALCEKVVQNWVQQWRRGSRCGEVKVSK